MKYYRQDKLTGVTTEITREQALDKLTGNYNDPVEVLDSTLPDFRAQTPVAYYWRVPNELDARIHKARVLRRLRRLRDACSGKGQRTCVMDMIEKCHHEPPAQTWAWAE